MSTIVNLEVYSLFNETEAPAIINLLHSFYNGRLYHNLNHIEQVIQKLKELSDFSLLDDTRVLILSALFHDIIYDVSDKCVDLSSDLAYCTLMGTSLDSFKDDVKKHILTTKTQKCKCLTSKLLNDADMSILGSDPFLYEKYKKSIRAEYIEFGVPEDSFNKGRLNFLTRMLNSRIFKTKNCQDLWEDQAKSNIKKEMIEIINL